MKTEHPQQSDNGICVIQKQLPEVLIHLSHWETRRSIPVLYMELSCWRIHNLTHSFTSSSEWNRRPRMPKMWKWQGEKSGLYGWCWSVSQPNLWSFSFTRLAVWRMGVIMQKDDSFWQHSRVFWLYGASQHPQPPRHEPHFSALCLSLIPLLDEHILHYTHLQSNKETTLWTCAYSLCISPTVKMAVSIRNNSVASFWEECVLWRVVGFHLTAPRVFAHKHTQSFTDWVCKCMAIDNVMQWSGQKPHQINEEATWPNNYFDKVEMSINLST